MASTRVAQGKEKEFDNIPPRHGFVDMGEEMQKEVVDICRAACKKQHDGDAKYYKDMAIYVKGELDKKLGGSFHVIIGKSQTHNASSNSSHSILLVHRHELRIICILRDSPHNVVLAGKYRIPRLQTRMKLQRKAISSSCLQCRMNRS